MRWMPAPRQVLYLCGAIAKEIKQWWGSHHYSARKRCLRYMQQVGNLVDLLLLVIMFLCLVYWVRVLNCYRRLRALADDDDFSRVKDHLFEPDIAIIEHYSELQRELAASFAPYIKAATLLMMLMCCRLVKSLSFINGMNVFIDMYAGRSAHCCAVRTPLIARTSR